MTTSRSPSSSQSSLRWWSETSPSSHRPADLAQLPKTFSRRLRAEDTDRFRADRFPPAGDSGKERASRSLFQLRPLHEDRGDLRVGEAGRDSSDDEYGDQGVRRVEPVRRGG